MWITGDQQDFAPRLHELPTGISDLTTGFHVEAKAYGDTAPLYQKNKWNKEIEHKWYEFTNVLIKVSSLDEDAVSFIDRTSIVDETQRQAVNTLTADLKAADLWNKIDVLYPMVGGTNSSHSYNLISNNSNIDTIGANITSDANGIRSDGGATDASAAILDYTSEEFNDNGVAGHNNGGTLFAYVTVPTTLAGGNPQGLIGTVNGTFNYSYIAVNTLGNSSTSRGATSLSKSISSSNFKGLIESTQNASSFYFYKNNELLNSSNVSIDSANQPAPWKILDFFIPVNTYGFEGSIGMAGLAPRMINHDPNFYNIVQAFQSTLNRNV